MSPSALPQPPQPRDSSDPSDPSDPNNRLIPDAILSPQSQPQGQVQSTGPEDESEQAHLTHSRNAHSRKKGQCNRSDPGQPDNWFLRKMAVFVVFALSIWSFYVVVGRVSAPMIQGTSTTHLSLDVGIATLVLYVFFWLMFMWTYIMIITVPPGFARDKVARTPPPRQPTNSSIDGINPHFGWQQERISTEPQPQPDVEAQVTPVPAFRPETKLQLDAETEILSPAHPHSTSSACHPPGKIDTSAPDPSEVAPAANALSTTLKPSAVLAKLNPLSSTTHAPPAKSIEAENSPSKCKKGCEKQKETNEEGKKKKSQMKNVEEVWRPLPAVHVGPRWCEYCKITKPARTHHCRHCGTCVMQYDHHCLWIGQCVGWGNHKFFITFNFWAGIFNLYLFLLLIISTTWSSTVDGEQVAFIVMSGWFVIFTLFTMLPSHIMFILKGETTLDSYKNRDQMERENGVLQAEFGFFNLNKKKQVRRRWNEDWGGSKPGEQWRSGSMFELWKKEMGNNWLGWILPIGRPNGDGINYEINPRFGPNGEWLRKSEWPKGIQ